MTTSGQLRAFASRRGLRVKEARLVVPSQREFARLAVEVGSAPAIELFAGRRGFIVMGSKLRSAITFSLVAPDPLFLLDQPTAELEPVVGVGVYSHRLAGPAEVVRWFQTPPHSAQVRDLRLAPSESLSVYENGFSAYFEPTRDLTEVEGRLRALVELLPSRGSEPLVVDEMALPGTLRHLVPMVIRYGLTDDDERQELAEGMSPEELARVRHQVLPLLDEIDKYLRQAPSDEFSARLGALAEFVVENERLDA